MPAYRVELLPGVDRDLDRLSPQLLARVNERIGRFATEPHPPGSVKLSGVDLYRIRVGDYRIVYEVDDGAHVVFVHRIRHRREVYRKLR